MKICVYGAGAVGGHLAVRLALAGNEVSVVARGAQLKAIQERGLHLKHDGQDLIAIVRASESPQALGEQDVVIVTTKATALVDVAGAMGPLLGKHTIVVFAQNGIPWWYGLGRPMQAAQQQALSVLDPDGIIGKAIGADRVVGAVVFSSNEAVAPGVIQNESPNANALVIGRPDDTRTEQVDQLRDALQLAGINSPATRKIRAAVWQKLQINLSGSTLCLLLEQPVAALREQPEINGLFNALLAEARSIAQALGDMPTAETTMSLPVAQPLNTHKPSILIDYEMGRPMELDAIARVPLALARAMNVRCPVLETVAAIATSRGIARGLHRMGESA